MTILKGTVRKDVSEGVASKVRSDPEAEIKQRACPPFRHHLGRPKGSEEARSELCFPLCTHCCALLLPTGHPFSYSLFHIQKKSVKLA